MIGNRLYKKEKLCSLIAIERLFTPHKTKAEKAEVGSAMAYPWRAVWSETSTPDATCSKFLISVPKKRLRHAVDRVTMRRRMREAYRLNRNLLPQEQHIDIIFIYVADKLTDYHRCCHSLKKIMEKISSSKDLQENM